MRKNETHEPDSRERSSVGQNFHLAPPRDGDFRALAAAAASWNDAQSRSLSATAGRVGKLAEARARFRDALGRQISPDVARRLREFSRHQRDALRALLRAGDSRNRLEVARNAREQSLRLMAESGVDRDKLRAMYGNVKNEFAEIVRPPRAATGALTKVSLQDVPKPIRDGVLSGDFKMSTTTSDGLTIFTPPYDGWWWKGSWWRSGGDDPAIDIYPDPSTGSIGHRSEWYDGDASDADVFTLDYDTSVSVWHKPAKSGVLDVHILATCSNTRYDIYLEDEWGWSDSDSYMRSYLTANVSPVIDDEDKTENWDTHIGGSPDGDSYVDEPFPPGNVEMFHLTTSQALAGGVWSMLRVGTYEHRFTFLNDVSTRQLMRNRWFVNAIFVRTQ